MFILLTHIVSKGLSWNIAICVTYNFKLFGPFNSSLHMYSTHTFSLTL